MCVKTLCVVRCVCDGMCVMLTHLFFPEYDPVEEELQVLICIINAKLLKAVEGQILWFTTQTHTYVHLQYIDTQLVVLHVSSTCLKSDYPGVSQLCDRRK